MLPLSFPMGSASAQNGRAWKCFLASFFWGRGFGFWSSGFQLGFRVLEYRGLGFRVFIGFRALGLGVWGFGSLGFRVQILTHWVYD